MDAPNYPMPNYQHAYTISLFKIKPFISVRTGQKISEITIKLRHTLVYDSSIGFSFDLQLPESEQDLSIIGKTFGYQFTS